MKGVLQTCGHLPLAVNPEQKPHPQRVLEPEKEIDCLESNQGDEEAVPSTIGQPRRRPTNN
jgi:hypothetical protein